MDVAIVLFTRDLRVHDNPVLALACARARQIVPAFVVDGSLTVPPNRATFLAQSLADLRNALRERGGDLLIRHGDPVAESVRLAADTGAGAVFVADDITRYAVRRRERLAAECARHRLELTITPQHGVVPAGDMTTAGGGHYRVFTPYWRAWLAATWRREHPVPAAIAMPAVSRAGAIPRIAAGHSPDLAPGGERAARERSAHWVDGSLAGYADAHDDLAADATSRLSAYLRFGCLSAVELARSTRARPGGEEFCRQLAWRDFFHQVTAAFPGIGEADYRPGRAAWKEDPGALAAWRDGHTGVPIVDAGMRQLAAEGFMHNRARMITASFLTRTLGIDWRHGYRHFAALLADGDVANNGGNWQWVAGTGNNTRPNRVLNPLRQAHRFDRDGDYVRRYVPELSGLTRQYVHTPWKLPADDRDRLDYPHPLVDLT